MIFTGFHTGSSLYHGRISGRFSLVRHFPRKLWYGRTASCVSYCMVCPNCNSPDLTKLSLVYAAGVYESCGRIGGLLLGSGDGHLLGKYKSASQSRLSKMASPPGKAPYIAPIISWLLGFFIVMAFAVCEKLSWIMGALSVGYLLILPAYLLAALIYNLFLRPKKCKDWNEEFICQGCGITQELAKEKAEWLSSQ